MRKSFEKYNRMRALKKLMRKDCFKKHSKVKALRNFVREKCSKKFCIISLEKQNRVSALKNLKK